MHPQQLEEQTQLREQTPPRHSQGQRNATPIETVCSKSLIRRGADRAAADKAAADKAAPGRTAAEKAAANATTDIQLAEYKHCYWSRAWILDPGRS